MKQSKQARRSRLKQLEFCDNYGTEEPIVPEVPKDIPSTTPLRGKPKLLGMIDEMMQSVPATN